MGGQLVFVLPTGPRPTLNLFSAASMENLPNHPPWRYVSSRSVMVAGSGAVSDGIWKWDNGSSAFPSVTLLWEPKRGRLLLPVQLRAHSKEEAEGLVARPASQWAHARKPKAWPPELESRSQDSRRGAPVTRAEPQSEAVLASRPFQSGLHLCSCHLS